jgi:hypothetical protein
VADNIALKASSLESNIEKVRNKLQDYFESSDQISGLVGKGGEVETISQKLYRIPIRLFRGGSYQKYNSDAGDMGSGSGMKITKLTAGYIYSDYVVEVSEEAIDTTATPGQAVVNVFAKQLSEAMDEMKVYDDIHFHGDGSGKLTNSASAYGSAGWTGGDTYTFAGGSDNLGVGKLREGMVVSVWDTLGTTKRVTSVTPLQIDHIDYVNKVVYLNGTVTSGASTDILTVANLTSDTAMQSFQSTWPLSGDTFRHGFRYANDATGTNYYLGQLKSTIPQLMPTRVNAGSSSLTFQFGLLGLDGLVTRRDASVTKGIIGIAHMAQRAQVHSLGIAINTILRSDKPQGSTDLMPSNIGYEETFDFCGITSHLSKREDRDRFDFINPKLWGRAQLFDTKFHDVGGKTVFESRTTTGTLKAARHFIIKQAYDFVCFDPGGQFYVDSLTLPTGY